MNHPNIINLNKNPLDYPGITGDIVVTWNVFQDYLRKIKFVGDVTNDFDKSSNTKKVINNYNKLIETKTLTLNNKPIDDYKNLKLITQDNIKAAQTFHNKNDSRVKIDGWVGSETSQLKYPIPFIYYVTAPPKINEAYIDKKGKTIIPPPTQLLKDKYGWLPIIWGNKQFVVSAPTFEKYYFEGGNTIMMNQNDYRFNIPYSEFILYNENTHKDKLQEVSKEWYTIGQNTEITKNAAQIELQREANNVKANVNKLSTDIKLKINTATSKL